MRTVALLLEISPTILFSAAALTSGIFKIDDDAVEVEDVMDVAQALFGPVSESVDEWREEEDTEGICLGEGLASTERKTIVSGLLIAASLMSFITRV